MNTAQKIDRITQNAAVIGFSGLVVMALLITWDGAARYLWLPRISGFSDYGEVVFPIVIASCFPAGLLRQTNVTVRVFGTLGGPRLHAALEAFGALLTLAFFGLLTWQFIRLTGQFESGGRTTRTIGLPLAPYWYVVTAIMAVCVPVQVYVAWSWIKAALRGDTPDIAALRDGEEDLADFEG
ncbi:TRAP transporter small permease [Pseudooceanicola sp. 502str34]|uniref:TRAP transporter small permease n=1 Tax=Maritimibacter alkaliphilus TaxID=404236 RepID=UPI001C95522D|nr:TRAP transporter small permease [Maritimibacter alkaliphilus]MBY6088789.1 TRAP transporter small permease subunit [Maritimibacter alkaliphilus]